MATFRKRGNKWQVQIRREGHNALSRTFRLKEDAERWSRHQERLIDLGEASLSVLGEPTAKLSELLERYVAEVLPKKRGADYERYHLRAIQRHTVAELEAVSVTQASVANYRDHRLTQVSPSTVRRELAILQHAFNVARKEWGMSLPDLREVSKPTAAKARERRLVEDDLESLSEAFRQCRSPIVRPAFLFALATGMRRGEVLSLRWLHIDLQANTAFLPMTKNGSSRTVPLSPMALQALRSLPETTVKQKASGDLVFPISANALRLSWERVKKRAGVKDLRFHDLRHEAISRFFEMGLSVVNGGAISGRRGGVKPGQLV